MKKPIILICLGIIIAAFSAYIYSCMSPSTLVTGTWNRGNVDKKYEHILVATLTNTVSSRAILEQSLASNLRQNGLKVSKSIDLLPPQFVDNIDQKKILLDSVRKNGVDAILTVSVIDKKTETRYVPGTYEYAPYPRYVYYETFWGYYDYWYPQFQTPGYYTEESIYFLETNLYDAQTEELVWSAQSETYDPPSLQSFADSYAKSIISKLIEQNIIQTTVKNDLSTK